LTDWDLVICDEAHKMAASFFGGEAKETKRYKLAKLLGSLCRHFLLMTATPHNGKEEDFQLFMALLDADRFEGKFRGTQTLPVPSISKVGHIDSALNSPSPLHDSRCKSFTLGQWVS
jgi:hypothetical protein